MIGKLRRDGAARGIGFCLPLFVIVFIGFNIPILYLLGWSVSNPFPTNHYTDLVASPLYMTIFKNTFLLALLVTAVCIALGYPLAYWMYGLSPRWQLVVVGLTVLPFWVSLLVRTYAWIVVLGNAGVVNRLLLQLGLLEAPLQFLYNPLGVTIGTVNILLPFLVLPLFAAMVKIDPRLLDAANSLGAPPRAVFWRVFFPLTLPALGAGAILVFILTLGFYVTPAILGGGRVMMVSNMLDLLINNLPRWELAAAASMVLLTITLILYALSRRVSRAYET